MCAFISILYDYFCLSISFILQYGFRVREMILNIWFGVWFGASWRKSEKSSIFYHSRVNSECQPVLSTHIWIVVVDTPHQISLVFPLRLLVFFFFSFCFSPVLATCTTLSIPFAIRIPLFFFWCSSISTAYYESRTTQCIATNKIVCTHENAKSEERVPKLKIPIRMVYVWMRFSWIAAFSHSLFVDESRRALSHQNK